eukprot:Colp12_sorted_trinity150504_noHs@27336
MRKPSKNLIINIPPPPPSWTMIPLAPEDGRAPTQRSLSSPVDLQRGLSRDTIVSLTGTPRSIVDSSNMTVRKTGCHMWLRTILLALCALTFGCVFLYSRLIRIEATYDAAYSTENEVLFQVGGEALMLHAPVPEVTTGSVIFVWNGTGDLNYYLEQISAALASVDDYHIYVIYGEDGRNVTLTEHYDKTTLVPLHRLTPRTRRQLFLQKVFWLPQLENITSYWLVTADALPTRFPADPFAAMATRGCHYAYSVVSSNLTEDLCIALARNLTLSYKPPALVGRSPLMSNEYVTSLNEMGLAEVWRSFRSRHFFSHVDSLGNAYCNDDVITLLRTTAVRYVLTPNQVCPMEELKHESLTVGQGRKRTVARSLFGLFEFFKY